MERESDKMEATAISKNLKRFKEYKFTASSVDEYNLTSGSEKTKIPVTREGIVQEGGLDKIAETISKQTGDSLEYVYNLMTRDPRPLYSKAAIVVISLSLIFFALSKSTLTGYAINNISNTTSNIGIFVCVVGILGLLYYKNRCKR